MYLVLVSCIKAQKSDRNGLYRPSITQRSVSRVSEWNIRDVSKPSSHYVSL